MTNSSESTSLVKVVNPLKQGLKLFLYILFLTYILVNVVNPLKQGLKHEVSKKIIDIKLKNS